RRKVSTQSAGRRRLKSYKGFNLRQTGNQFRRALASAQVEPKSPYDRLQEVSQIVAQLWHQRFHLRAGEQVQIPQSGPLRQRTQKTSIHRDVPQGQLDQVRF